MKMEDHWPILDPKIRNVFMDYISTLKLPSIDYFAIGIQDPINIRCAAIMSNLEWQTTFKTMNYPAYDPLRNAAFNSKRGWFGFDELDHLNTLGHKIMLERRKYGIRNGLVLVDRRLSHNYALTIATDYRRFNSRDFLIRHHAEIYRAFNVARSIIKPVTAEYILE